MLRPPQHRPFFLVNPRPLARIWWTIATKLSIHTSASRIETAMNQFRFVSASYTINLMALPMVLALLVERERVGKIRERFVAGQSSPVGILK